MIIDYDYWLLIMIIDYDYDHNHNHQVDVPENFRGDTALIAASEVKLVMKIIIVENWEEIIENYFNFYVMPRRWEELIIISNLCPRPEM